MMTRAEDDPALPEGRWVNRNGIRIWRPADPNTPTRSRYQALLAERRDQTWWTTPERVYSADDELTCRRRLNAALAEVEAAERRPTREEAG